MAAQNHILSVSALTKAVKTKLEGAFPLVWVRGQVTNVSRPASGHVYFSLRDAESSVAAVWFRQQQLRGERFDPMTGEVLAENQGQSLAHTLENGQEVVCAGKLTVYGQRGVYQLVVELAEETGLGRLQAEFDRLREKLREIGYFATQRKRQLPPAPCRIALVTSPHGAAVHDFLRMAQTRGHGGTIRLYPVPVQGEGAPKAIHEAFARIHQHNWAQVIVLVRGGGSLEDLWGFNTELVAQAVYNSPIPVLAGIGHEVDFTLADLTADVRAATPTHAATLLWPERHILHERLVALQTQCVAASTHQLHRHRRHLDHMTKALQWQSPGRKLELWRQRLATCAQRITQNALPALQQRRNAANKLHTALALAHHVVPKHRAGLHNLHQRLQQSVQIQILETAHRLERLTLRLEAVNPSAPLARGYALVQDSKGQFVRDAASVMPGERLRITVHQGHIAARVEKTDTALP